VRRIGPLSARGRVSRIVGKLQLHPYSHVDSFQLQIAVQLARFCFAVVQLPFYQEDVSGNGKPFPDGSRM